MNRVVADAHAAAFSHMMSHTEKATDQKVNSNRTDFSHITRVLAGSTERVRGRDGYAAFYSKAK